MENPSEHIESSEYFSWERFFTALLIEKTGGSYLQYSKAKLNDSYLQKGIQDKVLSHMQPMYRMHAFVTRQWNGRGQKDAYVEGTGADVFERGLCLPSDNKIG